MGSVELTASCGPGVGFTYTPGGRYLLKSIADDGGVVGATGVVIEPPC